jgi:hypothetical protein
VLGLALGFGEHIRPVRDGSVHTFPYPQGQREL